jgi:hypothetical protein
MHNQAQRRGWHAIRAACRCVLRPLYELPCIPPLKVFPAPQHVSLPLTLLAALSDSTTEHTGRGSASGSAASLSVLFLMFMSIRATCSRGPRKSNTRTTWGAGVVWSVGGCKAEGLSCLAIESFSADRFSIKQAQLDLRCVYTNVHERKRHASTGSTAL